ncbi:hypothetical protein ES703_102855 [subsurface metagenome]
MKYYERNAGSRKGYRNGYEPKRLKTAEGEINPEAPQLRETEDTYRSDLTHRKIQKRGTNKKII